MNFSRNFTDHLYENDLFRTHDFFPRVSVIRWELQKNCKNMRKFRDISESADNIFSFRMNYSIQSLMVMPTVYQCATSQTANGSRCSFLLWLPAHTDPNSLAPWGTIGLSWKGLAGERTPQMRFLTEQPPRFFLEPHSEHIFCRLGFG